MGVACRDFLTGGGGGGNKNKGLRFCSTCVCTWGIDKVSYLGRWCGAENRGGRYPGCRFSSQVLESHGCSSAVNKGSRGPEGKVTKIP